MMAKNIRLRLNLRPKPPKPIAGYPLQAVSEWSYSS